MTGQDAIVQARIKRCPLTKVDVLIDCAQVMPQPVHQWDDEWHGEVRLSGDEPVAALDFRCCHKLPVFVYAPNYDAGMAVAARIAEFEPATLSVISPEAVMHYNGEDAESWAL